jgi:hypothetical protein
MSAACPYVLIVIDFITLIIFNEENNYEAAHNVMFSIILLIPLL